MIDLSQELMAKAKRAHKSAITLFTDGDYDGTLNRAYYAMHDAAKSALVYLYISGAEEIRTHSGLIAAFSQHLVKTGKVRGELGKMLSRAEQARLIADYSGVSIDGDKAKEHLANAKSFISEIENTIIKGMDTE